ncbi:uncharacterized protein [Haliotis asinina]|uniref:uncharacterized protein n=1 Tax=Haliotis asinina TaxID=109174 RepID=UPI0035322767
MDESYHLDNGPGLCKMKRVIGYALSQSAKTSTAVRANDPRIEVETALALDRAPRIQTYIALKRKLKCDDEWLADFLHNHGLGILFKSLDKSTRQKSGRFYCVVLRIVIIQCIRAVMSSQTSLDYIIENEEFIRKFSTGLDTGDISVRKQIFELLSAICVYSKEGYARALAVFEQYKTSKKKRYRFSVVLDELTHTDNIHYKVILLEFINCVIIYTEDIGDRIRIRNEFYGLKLQDILNSLRKEEEHGVTLQLQLFEEHKANDDELHPASKNVDLSSPLDVFHAIYKQVCSSPQELNFLTCLQHLLKIDQNDPISDTVWQTVEQLVSKATLIESASEAQKLLVSTSRKLDRSGDPKCCCSCHKEGGDGGHGNPKQKTGRGSAPSTPDGERPPLGSPPAPPPPPPPPPPPSSVPPPPPPPPPPAGGPPPPPPPPPPGCPPPPPPPGSAPKAPASNLPQVNVPKPKSKMRTFQWHKISMNKVMGKSNLWTLVGKLFNNYKVDYHKMDELFSVAQPRQAARPDAVGTPEKKKENCEINLLDGKRSLNVNIFLKQFKMPNEEIVRLLREGSSAKFGAEKLKGLQKILPPVDEIEVFRSFDGDKEKLGNAEKFFVCLLGLPNYKLRIDGMLIKEEFHANMEWIGPSVEAIIAAAKEIKESRSLRELIYLVLIAGNYLNAGNHAGNAAGFKLSSLLKLTEIRANKPRMNLLHYVAQEAEQKNPKLLNFPEEMTFLKDASNTAMDGLMSDIKSITTKVKDISDQISKTGDDFKSQMASFLMEANEEVLELQEDLKDIDALRLELADFFCEEPSSFKLEDSFKTLQIFMDRFKKAIEENKSRRIQEEKAEAKRRQKESENSKKLAEKQAEGLKEPGDMSMDRSSPTSPENGSIVDMLLADVRSGVTNKKYNDGSFSVKKVQKVNLELASGLISGMGEAAPAADTPFVRNGAGRRSTRRSMRKSEKLEDKSLDTTDTESTCSSLEDAMPDIQKTRSRKSYATEDDASLIEFLNDNVGEDKKGPDLAFDRYGSLRRKRKDRKGLLDIIDRERAPSPRVTDQQSRTSPDPSSAKELKVTSTDRPSSESLADDAPVRPFRRTRSMYDKTTSRRYNSDSDSVVSTPSGKADDDTEDDVLERVKRKLYQKGRSDSPDVTKTPPLSEDVEKRGRKLPDTPKKLDIPLNSGPESPKPNNRWRVNISGAESPRPLETIDEKSKLVTPVISVGNDTSMNGDTRSDITGIENDNNNSDSNEKLVKTRERLFKRFQSSLDPAELDIFLRSMKDHEKRSRDDSDLNSGKLSIRAQISQKMGTDIDHVLKKIEDTDRAIDSVGVSRPMQKRPVSAGPELMSKETSRSSTPNSDLLLKAKRETRKKRAHVSLDEVQSALKQKQPEPDTKAHSPTEGPEPTKSPVVPPRRKSIGEADEGKVNPDREKNEKSGKLTGKQKFNRDRFGSKKPENDSASNRCKSNVEKDSVDKALKELEVGMSRSKSYDESVARNAMNQQDEFTIRNSGSAPDTTDEKRAILRGSASRLSMDPRRHGVYVPSDDSDNEMMKIPERRPSSAKSDSPKSQSRLSIKSTNTSTETLQADNLSDGDSSPEQRRRSVGMEEKTQRVSPICQNNNEADYSSVDQSVTRHNIRNRQFEPDDESPLTAMAKWRQKRSDKRRISGYDNITDHDGHLMPHNRLHHEQDQDLKSEVGSRSSYASSYASSNERDEGFESMSGTVSQRTSLSSNVDSEFLSTPILSRKADTHRYRTANNDLIANVALPEEDSRKQRTESWTASVMASSQGQNSKNSSLDSSVEYSATSPDSGHGTSKEEVWSEKESEMNSNTTPIKSAKRANSPKTSRPSTPKDTPKTQTKAKTGRSIPGFMKGTASASARVRADSTGTDNGRASPSPSTLSRNISARASMRAEAATRTSASTSFTRNTAARTSIRGTKSRLSTGSPGTNLNKSKVGGSNTSLSSSTSASSSPTKTRLNNTLSPSSRPTTPAGSSRPTTPSTLNRTQSMRVTSSKRSSLLGSTSAENKRSSTPVSSDGKKKPSFMSPTASSKAQMNTDSSSPSAPPRTKRQAPPPPSAARAMSPATTSSLTRTSSLRLPSSRSSTPKPSHAETPVTDREKTQSEKKGRPFLNKIGGVKKSESPDKSTMNNSLSTVTENDSEGNSVDKSPSFLKRIGLNKQKERLSMRGTTSTKTDSPEKASVRKKAVK